MLRRCNNPNTKRYSIYGGRGITVCDEWQDFKTFKNWALSHGYGEDLTIDRKNNDAGYSPDNCRWITGASQANNRRDNRIVTYKGITDTLANLCRHFNLDYGLVNGRIQKGWSPIKAISTRDVYPITQRSHLITYNGVTRTQMEWTKALGFKKNTLSERIRTGWTIEKALTTPIRKRSS